MMTWGEEKLRSAWLMAMTTKKERLKIPCPRTLPHALLRAADKGAPVVQVGQRIVFPCVLVHGAEPIVVVGNVLDKAHPALGVPFHKAEPQLELLAAYVVLVDLVLLCRRVPGNVLHHLGEPVVGEKPVCMLLLDMQDPEGIVVQVRLLGGVDI